MDMYVKKLLQIEQVLNEKKDDETLTSVKEKLSNDISYGEIKMVMAWMELEKIS